MIYQSFAQLYDELFDPAMYQQWLDFVASRVAPTEGPLLDLACGSGRLGVQLAQRGYDVSGLDLSEEMLALAEKHAEEAQVTFPLMAGNMVDLSEIDTYQTVTCFADSFCYLPDIATVTQAFTQVHDHLAIGGKFLFDVITPHQTDDVYPGYMYNYVDDDRAFLWTSYGIEDEEHAVEHDLTFFIHDVTDDAYHKVTELHHERTYALADYQQALQQAGLTLKRVSADFGERDIDDQTTRWFFEATREA
ncbi:class I SAM-dependent DNA methyltransferase [Levilactobacillus namurensis]|uniref:class I SAM-dependent DNA methyltransferase n=1 Tax=Levilactobacillus namurensis TaxID=380393 RepID=UPI001DEFF9A6|nr:class I SAM-dependent methyltransferase [Levilactobacillus namurensis]HJE44705.1 methyltransferase domain-containing protein [Levilactobacillus namurensis]